MKSIDKKNLDIILEWFTKSDLASATIEYDEKGSYKISLSRPSRTHGLVSHGFSDAEHHGASTQPSNHSPVHNNINETSTDSQSLSDENVIEIKAPLVGTFYRASSPDMPPFVQPGDKVEKGTVLCIIEAMKVMNEFEAEFDMEIVSILVENSNLVEYNQPIIKVIPL